MKMENCKNIFNERQKKNEAIEPNIDLKSDLFTHFVRRAKSVLQPGKYNHIAFFCFEINQMQSLYQISLKKKLIVIGINHSKR